MATKKRSVNNLSELGQAVTGVYSTLLRNFELTFGNNNAKEVMFEVYKAGAKPMIGDIKAFMAQHNLTGKTLESFNDGVLVDVAGDGSYMKFKFGFDVKKGGLPALFLEYGDNGSPMRMPNKAYYFMYYAVKNNIDQFRDLADAEIERLLKEVKGGL